MCGRQLKSSSIIMPRFSDDTPIEGLITNAFRKVGRVVDWCTKNNLELNVAKRKEKKKGKTKEMMIIEFRRNKTDISITPLTIREQHVELVWTHSRS